MSRPGCSTQQLQASADVAAVLNVEISKTIASESANEESKMKRTLVNRRTDVSRIRASINVVALTLVAASLMSLEPTRWGSA
jgi:tmRNA-binding protein